MSRKNHSKIWNLIWALLIALMSTACGGGSGSESSRPAGIPFVAPPAVAGGSDSQSTATISVAFSDGPASSDFAQALMVIREIRLKATDPVREDAVLSFAPLAVDLLQLTSFSEILFELEVPLGAEYYALELWVESLTLVREDGSVGYVTIGENGWSPVSVGAIIPAVLRNHAGTGTIPSFKVSEHNSTRRLIVNVDIPLDLALHQNPDGTYRLSPLANLSVAFENLFRVAGNITEVVGPSPSYPHGWFTICNPEKASAPDWAPQLLGTCAMVVPYAATVAPFTATKFVFDSADTTSGGVENLSVGDPIVAYGWWGIYVERGGVDPLQAMLIVRGTGFERARGTVSPFIPQDGEFTLAGSADSDCSAAIPMHRVAIGSGALILREHGERILELEGIDTISCAGIEVEGLRITPDELRAFAMVLRPPSFTGMLTRSGVERFTLSPATGEPMCVMVGEETELAQFFYTSMGPGYFNAVVTDLLGSNVRVTGFRGLDGCVDAERIVFVE